MSSHVVVIDKSARRYTFNVAPETVLNEVFQQACKKAGLDSSVYGLKLGLPSLLSISVGLQGRFSLWLGMAIRSLISLYLSASQNSPLAPNSS